MVMSRVLGQPSQANTYIIILASSEQGVDLAITTGTHRFYVYFPSGAGRTVRAFWASVGTAPAGQAINLRVNRNGSSMATFSIAAAANTSGRSAQNTRLTSGDYFTVDITQVGSTTVGRDLVVAMDLESS